MGKKLMRDGNIAEALGRLSPHSRELVVESQEDCAVRLIKGKGIQGMGLPYFLRTHLSAAEDNPLIGGQFL